MCCVLIMYLSITLCVCVCVCVCVGGGGVGVCVCGGGGVSACVGVFVVAELHPLTRQRVRTQRLATGCERESV